MGLMNVMTVIRKIFLAYFFFFTSRFTVFFLQFIFFS